MNQVDELIRLRDSGGISAWEETDRGIFGKRTFVRALGGGEDCVVVVRGRPGKIAWVVSGPGYSPNLIFAAGRSDDRTFGQAQEAADLALAALDPAHPWTYTPAPDEDTVARLNGLDLLDEAEFYPGRGQGGLTMRWRELTTEDTIQAGDLYAAVPLTPGGEWEDGDPGFVIAPRPTWETVPVALLGTRVGDLPLPVPLRRLVAPQVTANPKPTLRELIGQYRRGEFDPQRWNWCTGMNRVDLGQGYVPCVGLYVMGDGAEQLHLAFHWPADQVAREFLVEFVRKYFDVERVLDGVG